MYGWRVFLSTTPWSQVVRHAMRGRHQLYLMESRRVNRAKHSTQYWFSHLKKSKSSSFQRTIPGNLTGSWETNESSRASRFTPLALWQTLITCWFVTLLHQQDRVGQTQNTHAPTTCSACWQIPIASHHARSLSRKHRKALNRAWLSLSQGERARPPGSKIRVLRVSISPPLARDRRATALSVRHMPSFTAQFRESCHLYSC